jgi:hypothetical protein
VNEAQRVYQVNLNRQIKVTRAAVQAVVRRHQDDEGSNPMVSVRITKPDPPQSVPPFVVDLNDQLGGVVQMALEKLGRDSLSG